MLVNLLLRAKHLMQSGCDLFAPPPLKYFLTHHVDADYFNTHPEALEWYGQLDDTDIQSSIKEWAKSDDKVLSLLANNVVRRCPFKVEIHDTPIPPERIEEIESQLTSLTGVHPDEVKYLYQVSAISKDMYDVNDDHITILYKDGTMKDIVEASEILNVSKKKKKVRKYYLCYHRM